jgi:hypothetical protein
MMGPSTISLKPGELVEVRSREEILATLDGRGAIDGSPFMPEMLAFCGQTLRVFKRADKTCDTIEQTGGRRMIDAVHLEGARCSGNAHGGCQAGCLIFWKESWLKRVTLPTTGACMAKAAVEEVPEILEQGTRQPGSPTDEAGVLYRCQATELRRATAALPWWDVRQYARDVFSGNVKLGELMRGFAVAGFRTLLESGVGYRLLVGLYGRARRYTGWPALPWRSGTLKTVPTATLNLTPGEWVRVKSHDEILATLDPNNKNRGLGFDAEMIRYCGGKFQVQNRVTQIIEEKTGRMLKIKNSCIILSNVYCKGDMSKYRLFCPRAIYSYWREIWLERVEPPSGTR